MPDSAQLPLTRWQFMGYEPNEWAYDHVHGCTARFGTYCTCRQCGKSVTASMLIDQAMTEPVDDFERAPFVGLLAPTYEKCEIVVDRYITAVRRAFGDDYIKVNMNKHKAFVPTTGATLLWMSADDPGGDAGKGHTFSFLVTDESQDIPDVVMEKMQPALDVRMAQIRSFGTPDITPMQTWFRSNYRKGQDPDEPDYYSFTLDCYNNRWMSLEAILQAKARLPENEFRRLYLGEWVDEEGAFFHRIKNAMYEGVPEYDPKVRHVMSVDFALQKDFTVVIVAEEATKRCIFMERWSEPSAQVNYDRIEGIYDRFGKPYVTADSSGMGLPMVQELRERGLRVRGLTITGANKMEMLKRLAGDIEHRRIMFPATWKALVTELEAFVYKETPSGRVGAEAAYGYHDDCVAALMLINEGLRGNKTAGDQYDYTAPDREDWRKRVRMLN